MSELVKRRM